ncbi:hypothetical protein ABZ890_19970 [Streptomyces sp. NPDC046984]|uniref:hypothetical protein n=1 Tax=Streptomyces sp. NPDC046984 TaxID=3155138 RepID=UPI003405F2D5
MTQSNDHARAIHAPLAAVHYRVEPRPDGSTVLALLTVSGPYVLTEHLFELDEHLTRYLLNDLDRAHRDVPDPGPRPEAAAMLAALDSDDPTAFDAAVDAYTARLHRLWTNGGRA